MKREGSFQTFHPCARCERKVSGRVQRLPVFTHPVLCDSLYIGDVWIRQPQELSVKRLLGLKRMSDELAGHEP